LKLNMLLSDYLIWGLALVVLGFMLWGIRYPHWRQPWQAVIAHSISASAATILLFYVIIGLVDSIHFNVKLPQGGTELRSLLDISVRPFGEQTEETYSAPFSKHLFTESVIELANGEKTRGFSPLVYSQGNRRDILTRAARGFVFGLATGLIGFVIFTLIYRFYYKKSWRTRTIAWLSIWITLTGLCILVWMCALLATHYYILGTDKIGRDVFYETIKSIRTGLIIGTITTLFALPFALFLGTLAGYYRGWVDDLIQYAYTTLSSIPGVLLISASVLVLQTYMSTHAANYPTLAQRADVRLLALCFILGITGWASLCRFLRGETLKLRNLEYVDAARTFGVTQLRIILRHIIPNVFHIVIITLVLDFSLLVLTESVLSYIGVGVDPTTMSWGNMINSSRLELAREPVVWWPLLAALVAMFGLVLAANVVADAVRDAFDPYLRIQS